MDEQLQRMAANALSGGAQPPQQAAPQQAAPAPAPKPKDAPTTPMEKSAKAGPQTDGDRMNEEPMVYKVGDRQLTPQQISSTFDRYKDLNYKNAQMKPINNFAEKLIQTSGGSPEQIAKLMEAAVGAFSKNTTMGNKRPAQQNVAKPEVPSNNATQPDMNSEFAKYEDDNAISLPPGYREGMDRIQRMEQQLQQQMGVMNNVLKSTAQSAAQGRQMAQGASNDRGQVIQQTISNNLDRAQQAAGLPDEDGKNLMRYDGQRGYTIEDFADAGLAQKVVGDFKNQKNTPEFARLQQMASRREAFLKSQSGGPASQASKPAGDQTLARLTAATLNKNNNFG